MKTLYKRTKTKAIQQWSIWRDGEDIVVEHGQKDGKKQIARKRSTPKNVGKKNATTAEQQADLEIISMFKKKKDKGYVESPDLALVDQKILPMLANEYNKYSKYIEFPCFIQPKLNGVRCLYLDSKLMSRGGKEYNVPHISEDLQKLNLPKNIILDGEIYSHGESLQKINSWVKRNQENSRRLKYHVYDYLDLNTDSIFKDRISYLNTEISKKITDTKIKNIEILNTYIANKRQDLFTKHAKFLRDGYEGSIVRDSNLLYKINERSNQLLKIKDFKDKEYEIISVKEGEGKFKGAAIFVCKVSDNETVDVVAPGTMEEKRKAFLDTTNIGRMLTVKYFEFSDKDVPILPVGLSIRLEEDI